MKLALSTILYIYEKKISNINFFELIKIPINDIEIVFPPHANTSFLKELKGYNLNIFSGHADYIGIDISSTNEYVRQKSIYVVKKRIKFLKKIGAKILVLHPGGYCSSIAEREIRINNSLDSLARILPFAVKNNIKIALENMPNKYIADNPKELLFIINQVRRSLEEKFTKSKHKFLNYKKTLKKEINSKKGDIKLIGKNLDIDGNLNDTHNLNDYNYIGDINKCIGICLDFGHAHLTGNLNDYFYNENYFNEIVNMHAHDNFGDIIGDYKNALGDKHLAPGAGNIGWHEFINIIKDKYKGWFTFEVIPDEKLNNHLELLLNLKDFIKNYLI